MDNYKFDLSLSKYKYNYRSNISITLYLYIFKKLLITNKRIITMLTIKYEKIFYISSVKNVKWKI